MNLENGEARTGAFPTKQFVEVGIDRQIEPALIAGATSESSGQNIEHLTDVGHGDVDAALLERGPCAAPIAGKRLLLPDRFRLRCGGRWQRNQGRDHDDAKTPPHRKSLARRYP